MALITGVQLENVAKGRDYGAPQAGIANICSIEMRAGATDYNVILQRGCRINTSAQGVAGKQAGR